MSSVSDGASLFGKKTNYNSDGDGSDQPVPQWAKPEASPFSPQNAAPQPKPAQSPAVVKQQPEPMLSTSSSGGPIVAVQGEPIPPNAEYLWDGRKINRSADGSILWGTMGGRRTDELGREVGSCWNDGFPICKALGVTMHIHWSWLVYMILYLISQFRYAENMKGETGPYLGLVISLVLVDLLTTIVHALVEVAMMKMWNGKPYSITLWVFGMSWKSTRVIGPRKDFLVALIGMGTHVAWIMCALIGISQHPFTICESQSGTNSLGQTCGTLTSCDASFDTNSFTASTACCDCGGGSIAFVNQSIIVMNFDWFLCKCILIHQIFYLAVSALPVTTMGGGLLDGARMISVILFLWKVKMMTAAKIVMALQVLALGGGIGVTIWAFSQDGDYGAVLFCLFALSVLFGMASLGMAIGGGEIAVSNHAIFRRHRIWGSRRSAKGAAVQSAPDKSDQVADESTGLLWNQQDEDV